MTKKEALPFIGQPSSQDILLLLLSGGVDLAIISICSQNSSVSLEKDGDSLYYENGLDYNEWYINGLRIGLQNFVEQTRATIIKREPINLGKIVHVEIIGNDDQAIHFTVKSTGINNKFNRLTIARI